MKSIRKRLIGSFMIVAWTTSLLSAGGVLLGVYIFAQGAMLANLFAEAGRLALMIERDALGYRFRESRRPVDPMYETGSTRAYYQIWTPDRKTLVKSRSLGSASLGLPPPGSVVPDDPNPPEAEEIENTDVTLPNGRGGHMVWIRYNPMRGPGAPPPENPDDDRRVIVAVAMDNQIVHDVMIRATVIVLLIVLVVMVGLRLAAEFTVKRGLRSLGTLANRVSHIGEGEFAERIPETNLPEETAPFARAINGLLAKADAALERERRFSANAAHELRTPIAEMRLLADVSRRLGNAEALNRAMGEVVAVAMQMEATLTALLRISRRSKAIALEEIEEFDLRRVVDAAAARRRADAEAKQVSITVRAPAEVPIRSARALCTGIVTNLVDNAVEYTPERGSIEIVLETTPRRVRLSVVNGPVALEAADLERLTEPFWRKDPARGSGEHSGLGLSLVKAMVESLDASLEMKLTASKSFEIRVELGSASRES